MSEKTTIERNSVFVLKAINPVGHPELEEKYDQNLENGDKGVNEGDFTDDSGLAFTVDSGHEHPSPLYVFPLSALPLAELTEEMKNKMLDLREKYYKGEAL